MIQILTSREEYNYCVERGYEPLCDERFPMSHELRKSIQGEKFGKNNAEGNQKFYRWCLEHKPLYCEECGIPIRHPSATNVSHILSRGAYPEMAHDPRNINILCGFCHNRWEHSTTRKGMRIERKNLKIIEQLKHEYNDIE